MGSAATITSKTNSDETQVRHNYSRSNYTLRRLHCQYILRHEVWMILRMTNYGLLLSVFGQSCLVAVYTPRRDIDAYQYSHMRSATKAKLSVSIAQLSLPFESVAVSGIYTAFRQCAISSEIWASLVMMLSAPNTLVLLERFARVLVDKIRLTDLSLTEH